jgi:hypothetical protein
MNLMKPYIVTSWGISEVKSPEVKELLDKLGADKDGRLGKVNAYLAILNAQGELVYHFDGAQVGVSGRKDPNYRPHYLAEEFAKGWAKLKLSPGEVRKSTGKTLTLPEVKGRELPAGVRIFSRSVAEGMGNVVTVRAVALSAGQRKALSLPVETKTVEAETLGSWLELLQLPRVREADANIPFKKMAGSLKLQPAGADAKFRYATMTGSIILTKDEGQSSAEVDFQGVVMYRVDGAEVQSVRAAIEGLYHYRQRGAELTGIKISAALESTPE